MSDHFRFRTFPGRGLLLAITVISIMTYPAAFAEDDLEKGAKKTGHAIGSAFREIGKTAKKTGKTIGKTAKKVGKSVGKAAKEGGKAVKKGVKGED